MTGLLQWATFVTALGCGLAAGVFFAFSAFIMGALDRLPPSRAVAAMQSVNQRAVTPAFMTALFGTALACAALAARAAVTWGEPGAGWILAGSLLYLTGAVAVTIVISVPLNETLAAVRPDTAEAAARWPGYRRRWTAWNHVRAAAALGGAGLLTAALVLT